MQVAADRVFELLYRRHRVELYRWLLRETGDPAIAEDVLQTAFMQAYRALLRGDPPREPRAWLFAIARNANRLRFRNGRVVEAELDEDMPLSRDESLVWQLRDALAVLPPSQRAAIVLQEVGGLSYAEIAERLGVTTGAVQMLVFRARRRLRSELVGEPGITRLLLPLQPLLNALSRLGSAGDRALLVRGAAGLAGAVAIGGSVLAVPGEGDASPPARSARGSVERPLVVHGFSAHAAKGVRPAAAAALAVRSVRHPSVPAPAARGTGSATRTAPTRKSEAPDPPPTLASDPAPDAAREPAAERTGSAEIVPDRTTVAAAAPSTVDATAAAAPVPPVTAVTVPAVTVPALPVSPPPVPTVQPPIVPPAPPVTPPTVPSPVPAPLAAP